jgi:deazaflavin-dependent oxidoreductase (nitroreductase family)
MDNRPMYGHAEANVLKRAIRRSAGWKPLSLFYARTLHLIDRAVFRLTRGRATFSSWLAGLPVAWLTTTGAKSGAERTSPVLAIPCGDGRLIVIASNYGQRSNPSWYHNLCANPHVRILFEGEEQEMVARELEGDDRAHWYERGIDIYPGWVQYRKRAPRTIPVIELRAPGPSAAAGATG